MKDLCCFFAPPDFWIHGEESNQASLCCPNRYRYSARRFTQTRSVIAQESYGVQTAADTSVTDLIGRRSIERTRVVAQYRIQSGELILNVPGWSPSILSIGYVMPREFSTWACATRIFDAATIFMADVILPMFWMDFIRFFTARGNPNS